MISNALHQVATELGAVVAAAAADAQLNAQDVRRVLRFVARVAHVVEQALQDVCGLALEVKHVKPGDSEQIDRLRRELDLVLARSEYSKAEEICSRLRHLREQFERDVALLLRCSRGDARWHELFWLLEEREGRIIQLIQSCTSTMAERLAALSDAGLFGRSLARSETEKTADDAAREILRSLRELREIRDRIFGLSGQEGFLELTEVDATGLREQAHQLNVQVTTGDIYRTDIHRSNVGAAAIGPTASAQGSATLPEVPEKTR
ncbi:hypothetical protein [Sorangium sp. So ce131]|uniref:hypothetical protein n=1 Tax=Sorangium sp. So ce131 TaxID=3133282 RepID=UPI003F6291A9